MSEFQGEDEDQEDGYALESPAVGRFVNKPRLQQEDQDKDVDQEERDAEAAAFFADLGGGDASELHKPQATAELDGDEAAAVLPNKLYGKLHRHWLQERHCPELLPHDDEMFQEIMEHFEMHQEGIDDLMESSIPADLLMGNLAQQDLDRAKFVFSDWLTQRLNKIELFPLHNQQEKMANMSEAEQQHLEGYVEAMKKLLNGTVLHALKDEDFNQLDAPDMIDLPDYEGYHFWLVKMDIFDKDGQEHQEGVCLVAKYLDMKEHMIKEKVELLI
ncbi:MAG: hypothetical protein SGILL_010056 [Bacillariaceae sp.]